MNLLNQVYTAQAVAAATGTTSKQITDWCNQGQIVGQRKPLGKGRKREFSFFNVMEIASAVALMGIGIKSPADAFGAASKFAHIGDGASGWVGEHRKQTPERLPGLPHHHAEGETFLAVSGDEARTTLSVAGKLDTYSFFPGYRRPAGFIVLNVSEVFKAVMQNMGEDWRVVLDQVYDR